MAKYQGPSFLNGENLHSFNPKQEEVNQSTEKPSVEKKSWIEEDNRFEQKHVRELPEQVTHRQEVEKEFRQYLKEKKKMKHVYEAKRSKNYIDPPFEASKVPSPIYGFNPPPQRKRETWDYENLKDELKKENYEFLLFEEYETKELADLWDIVLEDEAPLDITDKQTALKIQAPKAAKRKPRLYRSLSGIIQEDQSGKNFNKHNVPGLFSNKKERDQS